MEKDWSREMIEDSDRRGEDPRVYSVDGHIFRLVPSDLAKRVEVLREGVWKEVFLTGEDVLSLSGVSELGPSQLKSLPA